MTTKEKVSQFLQTRINSIRNAVNPYSYNSLANKGVQNLAGWQQMFEKNQTRDFVNSFKNQNPTNNLQKFKNSAIGIAGNLTAMGTEGGYQLSKGIKTNNPNLIGKGLIKSGNAVLTAKGLTMPGTVAAYSMLPGVITGSIDYAKNKNVKGAINTGIGSAAEYFEKAPSMAAISSITNPLISKAGLGKGFIARNAIKSPLNVVEGLIMDKAADFKTTKESMLMDALFPIALDIGGVTFKSAKDALKTAEFKIAESVGKGARNKGGMYTSLDKFIKGTRPYRKNGKNALGLALGFEPYQDEQGNWKIRFNKTKALVGMGLVMGGTKIVGDIDDISKSIPEVGKSAERIGKESIGDAGLLKSLDDQTLPNTIAQEAKKYKSAEEFVKGQDTPKTVNVWIKSKFSNDGAYADIPVTRKVDNVTLYQGGSTDGRQFWTSDKKYAESFGKVTEKTGTFYKVDNGNRVTDVYVEAPTKSQLTDIWNQMNNTPTISKDTRFKKLNDLMNYNDRLVKEAGLSPEEAKKIGVKQGMEILESSRKVEMERSVPLTEKITPPTRQKTEYPIASTSLQPQKTEKSLYPQLSIPRKGTTLIEQLGDQTPIRSQALSNPYNGRVAQSGANVEKQLLADLPKGTPVKQKIGYLDYFRTPDRVLKKIGLGYEADMLRKAHNNYITELPKEINKITDWYKQVPDNESAVAIFKSLDGQAVELTPKQSQITQEIKTYLSQWADKLDLPQDKRITNYITHIFDDQLVKKEFDDDLAKLIQDQVAGSVYDPFTQQRLGAMGYKENVWEALDAYVKRATRKVNMDPALKQVKDASEKLETSQFDYVKSYIDRINMRPTKTDNLFDNTIKQIIGYKQGARPVAKMTRTVRQILYRGTLGLNIGSALRNLTQGVNTYAKLGEKYTILGYSKLLTNGTDELKRVGVLNDNMIEDRSLSSTKKLWENLDKGLFSFFELAEKVNRGSAYYGAKAQAISKGLDEDQAIEAGLKMVRDTQFTFGKIDTPVAMQSDLIKLLTQFQSYNVKQLEFMGELIKSKDMAGIIRYGVGSLAVMLTIGELLGMETKDLIPSLRIGANSSIKGMVVPPAFNPAIEAGKIAITGKDKYGNDLSTKQRIKGTLNELIPYVPAGVQIKKTVGGAGDVSRGYAQTQSGNVKYPVSQKPSNAVRGALFGGYALPEAQEYRKEDRSALSKNQSTVFKQEADRKAFYDKLMQTRVDNKEEDKIKEQVRKTSQPATTSEKFYYYDQDSEQVRTIKLNPNIEPPKLTGDVLYDKKLTSTYNSSITSAQSDIIKLADLGQMTQENAIKEINNLEKLRIVKPKKLKVVKPKKVTFKKTKKTKLAKLNIKPIGTTRQKSTLWATPKLKAPSGVNLEELRNPKV